MQLVFTPGFCHPGTHYGESIRHLDIRSGEHVGVSPLPGKKVKPSNNCSICDHLLHSNFLPSFDNFSVLAHENKKYLLEIKESLLIMRDKPSLNRNINSAPSYLFDKVSSQVSVYLKGVLNCCKLAHILDKTPIQVTKYNSYPPNYLLIQSLQTKN